MRPDLTEQWREVWANISPEERDDLYQIKKAYQKLMKLENDPESTITAIGLWDFVVSNYWRHPVVEWFIKQTKQVAKVAGRIPSGMLSENFAVQYQQGKPTGLLQALE